MSCFKRRQQLVGISAPSPHPHLDLRLLYPHFYCHILFGLLLLLEVPSQSGALSGKEAATGEFIELMGTRKLHSLQTWPSALLSLPGHSPPSSSCCLQIGPDVYSSQRLLALLGLFCSQCDQMSHYYLPFRCTQTMVSVVKNLPANTGDTGNVGSVPESERSPGVRNDNLLQYSCLEDSMDREAWWATVNRAAKSWIWLSTRAS